MNENQIEVSAKSVDAAVAEGLRLLDTTIDNVKIDILSQGGLFKKAKVKMSVIQPQVEEKKVEKPAFSPKSDKPQTIRQQTAPVKSGREEKIRPDMAKTEKFTETKTMKSGENKNSGGVSASERNDNFTEKKSFSATETQKDNDNPREKKSFESQKNGFREKRPFSESHKYNEKHQPEKTFGYDGRTEASGDVVKTPVTEENKAAAEKFLTGLFEKMNINVEIGCVADTELNFELKSPEVTLIGYRGETLDAIANLVSAVVNKGDTHLRINVDSNNYREKREQMLIEMAHKKAEKCIKTGRKVVLEPMNSSGRKIIHSALSDNDKVVTRSDGHEPNRRVIIYPKRNR